MNEKEVEAWIDLPNNEEFKKTGKAKIYRNPGKVTLDDNENITSSYLKYREYKDISGEFKASNEIEREYLYDQMPIVYGFTAYAAKFPTYTGLTLKNHLEWNKPVKPNMVFEDYMNFILNKVRSENDSAIRPKTDNEVVFQFYNNHFIDEKANLVDSEKYYSECSSDTDTEVKVKISEYVKAYLEFIQKGLNMLIGSDTKPESLKCNPKYTSEKLKQLHKLLIASLIIKRGDSVNNFLYVFGACSEPDDWQRVKWDGSNPKLTALVYKLTDTKPEHEVINLLFVTKKLYQRASEPKINNSAINALFNQLLLLK